MQKKTLKSANISYSLNDMTKSLYVPFLAENFIFGSGLKDPVWQQAAMADDFVRFVGSTCKEPEKKSVMRLFRTREHLVIGFIFYDERVNRLYPAKDTPNLTVWHGDLAELHFGSMGPDPWLRQLCVGISGLRFDSTGSNDWDMHLFDTEDHWGAELRLPLAPLLITEGGMGFNFCRCRMKQNDHYCWNPLFRRFHEVENFGELLFSDYDSVCLLRSGKKPSAPLDRTGFEKMRRSWEIPAQEVIHGPYLSNPEQNTVCVSWETAGRIPAFLEYRPCNGSEAPKRVFCEQKNGIAASTNNHFVHLSGLKEDTDYEYELFTLAPVTDAPTFSGIKRTFHTAPPKEASYSFFCVTDLHSDAQYLTDALKSPQAQKAAFHLLLGDNLSHAAGREALYGGIIDPIVEINLKKPQDTPLVFVRGNHEQLGVFASEYFNVMRHPSGRTWYAFLYGCAFYVVLDSGDDKSDSPERLLFANDKLLEEEKEFLQKITQSSAWKLAAFRIGFIHIPPLVERHHQLQLARIMAQTETKLDVLLSGHWHEYIRVDADTEAFAAKTALPATQRLEKAVSLPFPRVVLSTDNMLHCQVTPEKLELDILQYQNDGTITLYDNLVINR